MRIVYLHQHFRTPAMVGGTRSFEFARRLVQRGHSVDLITARPDAAPDRSGVWTVTEEEGITVHWCAVPYGNAMGVRERLDAFARFATRATRRASRIPQDLVFATSTPLTIAVPGVLSARRHGVPLVFEVRDVWPEVPIALGFLRNPAARRAALALEAWAYRNSAAVIALSPGMADSVASRFPSVQPTVIPNASDADLFGNVTDADVAEFRRRRPWLADRKLVLYAGTLGEANDVGFVVRLAAAMRAIDPDVRFLIAGEGKERHKVADQARASGVLGRNLFMEPMVPKSVLPTLLGAADVSVSSFLPVEELHANSANKVFDAFAAGRPVVVNHGGWLRDVLAESGAGLALPAADPTAGALILAGRIRDEQWMREARAASRRLAIERFDRDQLFEQFERVLLQAAASRPTATRPS